MTAKPVIAILFPGDMGTQIAKTLIRNKYTVITAGEGRSQVTLRNIKDAGINDVDTLHNIAEQANIIISLANPEASPKVAENMINHLKDTDNQPIFIDLNSNTPGIALSIEKMCSRANIRFVNGAVMGASKDVPDHATFVVSGIWRNLFSEEFNGIFKIKDAGEKTEAASAYKLLFSMVNKGMNALFFETMIAASHYGILDELNESLQEFLPGTYRDLIKTTPTYPQHISRRIDEMKGLTDMLRSEGLPNTIAAGTAETFERVDEYGIFKNEKFDGVTEVFRSFKKLK